MQRSALAKSIDFVAVPWAMFVAAFLYYVGLTLVAIGVEQVSDRFMAIGYLAPLAAYIGILLVRAFHAIPHGHARHAVARHA